jgi:hypothetical protein
MNGKDFYSLAVSLAAGSTPAEMRSSISRAYYGAFHRACELLEHWRIALPLGPECHTKVRFLLEQSGDAEIAAVSSKLSTLRIARNNADYALKRAQAETRKIVAVQLQAADDVISCLDGYFLGDTVNSISEPVREYARSVLRLPVT